MADATKFRIDDLELEPGSRRLMRNGAAIDLPKLSFDLFVALAEASPNVLTTDELIAAVWGGVVVSDETVTQRVKMLRDALDHDSDKQRYVETVRSVGYRLRPEAIRLVVKKADWAAAAPEGPRRHRKAVALFAVLATIAVAVVYLQWGPGRQDSAAIHPQASIAVLPFVAMSEKEEDGFFADGVTEEIINALTRIPGLLVTARTSAFYFKDRHLPVTEVGATLGVANVLEGSVRREGDRLRITTQLVRSSDGFHVWSDTFDYVDESTFDVQLDIAETVAANLNILMDDAVLSQMRAAGVYDPQAFVEYQRGLRLFEQAHSGRFGQMLLRDANVHFERAIERAPAFVDAYVKHADYYSHLLLFLATGSAIAEYTSEDRAAVGQAFLSDMESAVRASSQPSERAVIALDKAIFQGDWANLKNKIVAITNAPTCTRSSWLESVALPMGHARSLEPVVQRWMECDPYNFETHMHRVRLLLWLRDFDAVRSASDEALTIFENRLIRVAQVLALIGAGDLAGAQQVVESRPDDPVMSIGGRALVAASLGDGDTARAMLERAQSVFELNPGDQMAYHALMGDRDVANSIAARADANPYGHMVLLSSTLTCYCGAPFDIEVTPNFARMLEQSGLQWPPKSPIEWPLKNW